MSRMDANYGESQLDAALRIEDELYDRKRVTPPQEIEPFTFREPPSIRWRKIAQILLEARNALHEIQTRTDGLFGSYNADQREKCREIIVTLGPHIADVMREVRRKEDATNKAFLDRLQRQGRLNSAMEG